MTRTSRVETLSTQSLANPIQDQITIEKSVKGLNIPLSMDKKLFKL